MLPVIAPVVSPEIVAALPHAVLADVRWYRWTYANVDRLVVFSSNQRPLLASLLNRDPDSIDVVGFGVDVAEVFATGRATGSDARSR